MALREPDGMPHLYATCSRGHWFVYIYTHVSVCYCIHIPVFHIIPESFTRAYTYTHTLGRTSA